MARKATGSAPAWTTLKTKVSPSPRSLPAKRMWGRRSPTSKTTGPGTASTWGPGWAKGWCPASATGSSQAGPMMAGSCPDNSQDNSRALRLEWHLIQRPASLPAAESLRASRVSSTSRRPCRPSPHRPRPHSAGQVPSQPPSGGGRPHVWPADNAPPSTRRCFPGAVSSLLLTERLRPVSLRRGAGLPAPAACSAWASRTAWTAASATEAVCYYCRPHIRPQPGFP